MTVDISSKAVERLAGLYEDMPAGSLAAVTLRAQAERIKELEAQNAAGLRREKDANERAMQHLRRAEKAEIASKNHAAFSNEWRVKFETARNNALREALEVTDNDYSASCPSCSTVQSKLTALIEGESHD